MGIDDKGKPKKLFLSPELEKNMQDYKANIK